MTPPPLSSLDPTTEIDVETITAALNRKLKAQAIVATVTIDVGMEIYLSGLSSPHQQQMTNVTKQVLGKLQIPEQTVKVFGKQVDATQPSWERDVWIEPIAESDVPSGLQTEPAIDREYIPPTLCPDNNMILAIVATFFGVLPLGIVAISYASQVNYKHATGDTIGANIFANNAKRLSVISLSVSGVITTLIVLAIILPLFLGGGFRSKVKQENAAQKYAQAIIKTKMDELVTANMRNNNSPISTSLNSTPPPDIDYKFEGHLLSDPVGHRNNFMLTATPTSGNLRSFVGFVYTIERESKWFVKNDACISNSSSFFPPVVTINNGTVSCDRNSKLASEQSE